MEKNQLLIFSNTIRELYRCRTYAELRTYFLPALKLLVPFRYASILLREERDGAEQLTAPLCLPPEFEEAEQNYIRFAADDPTRWLRTRREATVIQTNALVETDTRFRTNAYQKSYKPFQVYDSLQCVIACGGVPLGLLTLYHSQEDPEFTEGDLFLLQQVGEHLNQHLDRLLAGPGGWEPDLTGIAVRFHLTGREAQLLALLAQFRDNQEIAETLQVRDSTLQKHLQNLFRKLGVASRWEVMRLLREDGAAAPTK